jgi:HlyD family secretion protein
MALRRRFTMRHAVWPLFLLPLAIASCRSADKAQDRPSGGGATPPLVEVLQARQGRLPLELRLSGIVRAQNQVEIRPEIAAVVAEVLVRSGDTVTRGQPLVRLDPDPQRQELRQGQASVRLAQAEAAAARARVAELEALVSRTRQLAEREVASRMELETQEAQLAAAQASVTQAQAGIEQTRAAVGLRRTTLDKTVLRAPIAGRVGRRQAEMGMLVNPSSVLFVVGDLDQVIIDVPLTEKALARVQTGMPASIRGPALGEHVLQASLTRVSPFLAPGSFSTTGEIDVDNRAGRLLPGMFVTVDIATGESDQATLVPVSAVWEDAHTGLLGVYVVDRPAEGKAADTARPARLRPVEIRAEGRSLVGVAGIQPGDWVVTLGQHLLAAATTSAAPLARVRVAEWDRVLALQSRQHEDLLAAFLEKQQRLARTVGAVPPTTDQVTGGGTNGRVPPTGR